MSKTVKEFPKREPPITVDEAVDVFGGWLRVVRDCPPFLKPEIERRFQPLFEAEKRRE